jgi:energy-converting hydrogenase Eha subunit G
MSNKMIFAGIVVGVVAMGAAIAYGTANQASNMSDDLILTDAAKEGLLAKTGSMGADLNKDKWYEDPYAEKAAQVRAAYEANNP